jgi:hypothetical protein
MHTISSPEAAMNVLRPDTTIEQLLTDFLADQAVPLGWKDHRRYAHVIDLLESSLERYRPGRRRETHDATVEPFCTTYGVAELTRSFSWFLNAFLPDEIKASPETLQTAQAVIQALDAWLTTKGYVLGNPPARNRDTRSERHLSITPYFPDFLPD